LKYKLKGDGIMEEFKKFFENHGTFFGVLISYITRGEKLSGRIWCNMRVSVLIALRVVSSKS
jgi:hypothetical protein